MRKFEMDKSMREYIMSVIECERELGMNCGGMDQTISILGKLDKAIAIEFEPNISINYIDLSAEVTFIIANSCTVSIKSESSYKHYNKRVIECRIGLCVLLKQLYNDLSLIGNVKNLG